MLFWYRILCTIRLWRGSPYDSRRHSSTSFSILGNIQNQPSETPGGYHVELTYYSTGCQKCLIESLIGVGMARTCETCLCPKRLFRNGLGRAVRPCSLPALRSSAGAEPRVRPDRPARAPQANVEASSVGGGGSRPFVCRDDRPRLTGGSPSGAEASSGPLDSRRSTGRGVEEVRGLPRAGTPGNPGCPSYHTSKG